MKTGIYNIETRECTDGKAYIMECSPRGGGNRLAEMVKKITGVDMISNAVKASLGMKVDSIKQVEINENWMEIILHSDKAGFFQELYINDKIRDNVVEKDLWIKEGTKVGGFSGANEAIGTLVLKFKDENEMNEFLKNQNSYIKVIVK